MNRVLDTVRATFASPELLCLLLPVGIWTYWPAPFGLVANLVGTDLKWGFGLACVPFGLLAASYKFGTELLSPSGKRSVLLQWENYWMLKYRVLLALAFCILAFTTSLLGFYFVAFNKSSFGIALMVSGCISAASALATIALARWRSREILGE